MFFNSPENRNIIQFPGKETLIHVTSKHNYSFGGKAVFINISILKLLTKNILSNNVYYSTY